jgi:hypothetical protein
VSDAALQRLVDEAAIRDLLLAFGRALDAKRTAVGWRFRHVALEVWWTAGVPFAIEPEPAAG